jgi:hypothetical protein
MTRGYYKTASRALLWALAAMALPSAAQAINCSFEIEVKTPLQVPVARAEVWLTRTDGEVYTRTQTDDRGIARLCDSPIGPVDIQVGGRLCGAVVVKYLEYKLKTTHVRVTYERCEGFYQPTACSVLLRAHDQQGQALKGASFAPRDSLPGNKQATSDEFGRLYLTWAIGSSLTGAIVLDGYENVEIALPCKQAGELEIERSIILHKK